MRKMIQASDATHNLLRTRAKQHRLSITEELSLVIETLIALENAGVVVKYLPHIEEHYKEGGEVIAFPGGTSIEL